MRILILGSGGREHAFAWKLAQSTSCEALFTAPGNAGTSLCGRNIDLKLNDFAGIKSFILNENISLVLVGPEAPLVDGIYDYLLADEQLQNLIIVGPSEYAAQLEGSKSFAKEFMSRHQIPTARYQEFTKENLQEGLKYLNSLHPPIVLKADGLAAGKGVLILDTVTKAKEEFEAMLSGKFGKASEKIVVEDFLDGIEFSVFALTDGKDYVLLPIAKDYKRIGEKDTGLNTGGMGAISPVPFVDEKLFKKVIDQIVEPTIKGLQKESIVYKGFVFFGLINVGGDPYVIEYNCRMGDPETEAVIPRLNNDLISLFTAMHNGKLAEIDIDISPKTAGTIMLVSGGYPEAYEKGKVISGSKEIKNSQVFYAGTKSENGQLLTNGGRVLAITSMGEHIEEAIENALKQADNIQFEGKYFRKDIGFDLT